jgi:RNA polymerase sigma-70 factor (ECF subfamily)
LKDTYTLKELLLLIAEGDSDAFGKFYDLYFRKVYRFTGYFIKADEVCEEIVSDVFLTLWISREKLTEIDNLDAFIFTIARNKAFNYLSKNAKEPRFIHELPLEFSDITENPEKIVLTDELKQVIKSSIEELPEKCKLVFLLSREEGLKYKDIAEIMSISEKTVNAQIVTALKKIYFSLKNYLTILL